MSDGGASSHIGKGTRVSGSVADTRGPALGPGKRTLVEQANTPGADRKSPATGGTPQGTPTAGEAAPDLGNYKSPTGKHVVVVRTWDNSAIAIRRVELQGELSRTTDLVARNELMREYEAIEWVARERNLALPKDPAEEAAPQAFMGGKPTKFWAPNTAQGMRAMLEREMVTTTSYREARDNTRERTGYATAPRGPGDIDRWLIAHQQTALMDHDAAAFRAAFQSEAKQTALSMLDASSVAIDSALRAYGIAGGKHRLTDAAHKVARNPDVLDAEVDKWVALSSQTDGNHAAFDAGAGKREDLVEQAAKLRGLQDNIAELTTEERQLQQLVQAARREHATPAASRSMQRRDWSKLELINKRQPLEGSVRNPFEQMMASSKPSEPPEQRLAFVQRALRARQGQFTAAWIDAERQHPVLAAYRGRRSPDAQVLPSFGNDESVTRSIVRQVLPKLGNIYRTKAALAGAWGTLDPMRLAPAVELTKQRMFVAEGSFRDRVVHDMVKDSHDKPGDPVQWALEAMLIAFTMLTLAPTAGGSVVAGAALAGLAYDIYSGLNELDDIRLASATTNTDIDELRSLSNEEPSLAPLLLRIVSAGVNHAIAVSIFKRAVAMRRQLDAADPAAVAALNRAGEAAGVSGVGDEAIAGVRVAGNAASPRVQFRPNPDGQTRSVSEALQIAERNGVDIDPERFRFVVGRGLPDNVGAEYFRRRMETGEFVSLGDLTDVEGRFVIRLNPNILNSDDKIVAVIAHETFEIDLLERAFVESGGRLGGKALLNLIDAQRGSAHSAAWDYADRIIEALQAQGKLP